MAPLIFLFTLFFMVLFHCVPLSMRQGSPKFCVQGHISYYTIVRGLDMLRNVIVSGYVIYFFNQIYQINKYFVNIYLSIIGKMASRAGFGPRAVVWRSLL